MIEAQPYPQEEKRLASLRRLNLLDMPIEERFERITRMVCNFLDVPVAIFNLLDHDRQHYKSVQGLDVIDAPLPPAFCKHAILEEKIMIVPDARQDQRFHDNPFVTGGLSIRFYAACPVRTSDGMPIGTLCAIDTKPRSMTADDILLLQDLTAFIEAELRANDEIPTARKDLMRELNPTKRLSLIDPMTRLWGYSAIQTLLEKICDEAKVEQALTIIIAGVDNLDKIKAAFGEEAGGNVMKEIARKMLQNLRRDDDVGRFGVGEFMMVLPGGDAAFGFDTADRICRSVSHGPIEIGEFVQGTARVVQSYPVTMSFGVATIKPTGKLDAATLVRHAEENLAKARREGGNRVVTT